MNIHFSKYQGTGNDFILIDDKNEHFPTSKALVQKLCDRHFGIGADGLILIQKHPTLDYRMIYFNSDGSQSLCGNGSRCGFAFAQSLGMVAREATFETTDGIHQIKEKDGLVHFKLFDVAEADQLSENEWFINTGSPHHVKIIDGEMTHDQVLLEGREIRNQPRYISQNGTNVNFAQLLQDVAKVRTYERGVENETLSCGTGATAVALVAARLGYQSPASIETQGGSLAVSFDSVEGKFTNIWLAGPAQEVFKGTVTI